MLCPEKWGNLLAFIHEYYPHRNIKSLVRVLSTPPIRKAICKWDFEIPSGIEECKNSLWILKGLWFLSDSLLNWLPHFNWLPINILPSKPLLNKTRLREHPVNWCLIVTFDSLSAWTQTACFKEPFTSPSKCLWVGWFPGMDLIITLKVT